MTTLAEKRAAWKALKQQRRTNHEENRAKLNPKEVEVEPVKRFIVYTTNSLNRLGWQMLFSTDNQGQAVQFVIEARWSKLYPYVSWVIIDREYLKYGRTHNPRLGLHNSEVMKVAGKPVPPEGAVINQPMPPTFNTADDTTEEGE